MMFDVAVAGAGPAGSATAALLARRGYRVVLVDRASFPRDKTCAEYCSPGVEEVLRRIGAWPGVAKHVRRVTGMTVYAHGRPILPVTYGTRANPRTALTIPRLALDAALMENAGRQGAEVRTALRVTSATAGERGGVLRCEDRRRMRFDIHARLIVASDGIHSTVGRSLGIRAHCHRPLRLGLITHYSGVDLGQAGEMHVGSRVYCGLAPLPAGLTNVGMVVPQRWAKQLRLPTAELLDVVLERLPGVRERLKMGRRIKPLRGIAPMTRRVERVCGTGYLLVGDAAGFLDPFTGEGIYRALRGAELAAAAIDSRLTGDGGNQWDLSSYAALRRTALAPKERFTWLVQAALLSPSTLSLVCGGIRSSDGLTRAVGNVLGDLA